MIYTRDGHDLVACDDPLCGAVTEIEYAEDDGWAVTRLTGPHYCPFGVEWRFRSLVARGFGDQPA